MRLAASIATALGRPLPASGAAGVPGLGLPGGRALSTPAKPFEDLLATPRTAPAAKVAQALGCVEVGVLGQPRAARDEATAHGSGGQAVLVAVPAPPPNVPAQALISAQDLAAATPSASPRSTPPSPSRAQDCASAGAPGVGLASGEQSSQLTAPQPGAPLHAPQPQERPASRPSAAPPYFSAPRPARPPVLQDAVSIVPVEPTRESAPSAMVADATLGPPSAPQRPPPSQHALPHQRAAPVPANEPAELAQEGASPPVPGRTADRAAAPAGSESDLNVLLFTRDGALQVVAVAPDLAPAEAGRFRRLAAALGLERGAPIAAIQLNGAPIDAGNLGAAGGSRGRRPR